MRVLFLCLTLHLVQVRAQFRGFSSSRSSPNHDLLKQIVDHTPEEEEEATFPRFGGRRTSILDRARSRPSGLSGFQRPRPKFKSSIPRFGSGANSLNVVTQDDEDVCEDLRSENDLLKKLVEQLTKQQKAAEAKEKLLQSKLQGGAGAGPLSLISEALRSRLGVNNPAAGVNNPFLPGFNERGIRRVLTQEPQVTTSTIVTTTSYESLITSSVTRDLSVLFQGRYSTTYVLDTVIETSTITDTLTSVVTITPSLPQLNSPQLNTINYNADIKLPTSNHKRVKSFNTKTETPEGLDSFETLRGYLDKFQKKTSTPGPSTTTRRPLIARLKHESRLKSFKRPNLFANRDLIKDRISSSLVNAVEETTSTTQLEPSFSYTSSSYPPVQPYNTHTAQAIQQAQAQATSSAVDVVSMIVNVASNVRVATAEETSTIETVTLQTVTSVSQNVEPAIISEPSIETIKTVLPVPVVQTGVPIPVQSSIVTVYISGSVPGVFTTSLSTVFYNGAPPATTTAAALTNDDGVNTENDIIDNERAKRHAKIAIAPTRTVKLDQEITEEYFDLIESSLNSLVEGGECKGQETVTVTKTVSQCSAVFL